MNDHLWWQSGVIYQVYPRSFQDSDGDGVGDLAGIEQRLDHLVDLGIDAIWLSPIYPSPMVDFGYDVADYCGIDPLFGSIDDFDRLIAAIHARGLKLIMDFVPNHSSDQHPWFRESRSSRDNPKRDWYIWRDAAPDGGPPNNWISDFGGSAWTWDDATRQYYYHAMLIEQPDLNWRNPDLQRAMLDAMRFWFDRGVDGFRVDILWHIVKAADFPDNPPNPDWRPGMADKDRVLQTHSTDRPEIFEIIAQMRAIADHYPGRVLIGEIYLGIDRLVAYYGSAGEGVQLPFNFHLIETPWRAEAVRALIATYEAALPPGGWPNWVLGNHDRPRIATRIGPHQARVAATLLLTLRGTPTLYQGDELGLEDAVIPPERVRDPRELREPGLGFGRDPVRAPMPWNANDQAGFSTVEPWLPLAAGWPSNNAATQAADPTSMLSLHRTLLALRRAHPALAIGALTLLPSERDILVHERSDGNERIIVALNFDQAAQPLALPDGIWLEIFSTSRATDSDHDRYGLDPDEGLILIHREF